MPPESQPASNIFISYRRDDSAGHAGRLFDRLSAHFGDGQIFMDIDHIEPGADFAQAIEEAVGSCEVLIALIGQDWLASADEAGRRLDNPNDFVRLEISAALARGVRVIPLLVQGARMPRPQDLPEDLSALSRRNALELSDARWKYDVDQLIAALEKTLARKHEARLATVPPAGKSTNTSTGLSPAATETTQRDPGTQAGVTARLGLRRLGLRKPVLLAAAALTFVAVAAVAAVLFVMKPWQSTAPPAPLNTNAPAENKNTSTEPNATPSPTNSPVPPAGMVYVPGGEFMMGRDGEDVYERPAHSVNVRPFFIDANEVTCEEYAKFIRATGHAAPPGWAQGSFPPGAGRKPVTGVTWDDAVAFSKWAGKRLPTEAEWEFAARGNDGRRYPWGDDWRAGAANAEGASGGAVDVGSFQEGKSPFGAFDMVGNVWEWTASKLTSYPGGSLPATAPDDWKVIRGGSFESNRNQATTTYRRSYPERGAPDYSRIGFRCVSGPPSAPATP